MQMMFRFFFYLTVPPWQLLWVNLIMDTLGALALCRCPDPAVRIPTSNAAYFLVPDVDAKGNTVTHGFILVPATGPYVQQRGCARALYYLALVVPVVGGYRHGERGREAPRSVLERKSVEADARWR